MSLLGASFPANNPLIFYVLCEQRRLCAQIARHIGHADSKFWYLVGIMNILLFMIPTAHPAYLNSVSSSVGKAFTKPNGPDS